MPSFTFFDGLLFLGALLAAAAIAFACAVGWLVWFAGRDPGSDT